MKIEEAIKELKEELKEVITWLAIYKHNEEICEPKERRKRAIETAIMALEQQPSEDCISREQAIRATYGFERYTGIDETPYEYVESILRDLPSVTPKADSEWGSIGSNTDLETVPTNLQDWLSTFNTESATECFTAVQQLKRGLDNEQV